jgi:exodeoxyribonuclease V gamma subunit
MSFHLYSSNRLENLATALGELCRDQPLAPLVPETIVVQSGGMARWLNFCLARQLGVSANLDCPFPNGFLERIFRRVLPGDAGAARLDQSFLHWSLMKILPALQARPGFEVLDHYLAGGSDLKTFQLAGRLADLFDQYLTFRPDLIAAWERGRDDSWQARLWRELLERAGGGSRVLHRVHLYDRLLATLAAPGCAAAEALPRRFSVFGLSSLPPFHLRIFEALARQADVHFFLLNPCRQYWGDILPARTIDRLAGSRRAEELHLSSGNRLLAALGQQGRELFGQLLDCEVSREYELFREPEAAEPATLLTRLQSDILDLHEGQPDEIPLAAGDRSIQLHSCHSPMRELEVLHDRLLALFEADPGLEPREVLVMTPDIESYSALIQAVFGSRNHDGGAVIPFRIADRFISNEGELVGSFLALLKMVGTRMEISRVVALLEMAPVRARFGLSPDEVELCAKWLAEVNVRWGIDEEDRRQLGLPATRENTWRFGLERLLLGYAMRGLEGHGFADILPYDDLEGGDAVVLGKFLDFAEKMFVASRKLPGRRTLRQWSVLLLDLAAELLAVEDYRDGEWRFLGEALQGLAAGETAVGYSEPVSFEVALSCLERVCRADRLTAGFLAGGVTFCELLPMRSVPFKVICLLGLNDGAFPRPEPRPSFDLIAAQPRPGDRSRRKDDRYLFLEVLLSARQHLHLSYVGRSVRDGSELPPSVLVSELREYLQSRCPAAAAGLAVSHPLQPFSPEYFAGHPELFSYSRADFQAARALAGPRRTSLLAPTPLPAPPEEKRVLELAELVGFFKHPARFFCRHRLGITLEGAAEEQSDSENFTLEPLARYQLGGAMVEALVDRPRQLPDFFATARRQGILPHGHVGSACYEELRSEAVRLAENIRARGGGEEKLTRAGELQLAGFVLRGQVPVRETSGQLRFRFAKLKATDLFEAWLTHLFLNCLELPEPQHRTTLIARDCTVSFTPPGDSRLLLTALLALYWQGLRQPLPFFPATSREYFNRLRRGGTPAFALEKARSVWAGDEFCGGESDDPYHQLCYRGLDPLSEDFSRLAVDLWEPMLEVCHGQ